MKISISFAELSDYINRHYGKQVSFSKVSDKEFCASYSQKILFKTIQVPVSIKIDDVKADSVAIAYNGGFGIDMIIVGVLSFLKSKVPELGDALVSEEGHRVRIELSKLSQTAMLVKNIAFDEINFDENGLTVDVSLK